MFAIQEVSFEDIDQLKTLAKSAILSSVVADELTKSQIVEGTFAHIENNIHGGESVFLKCCDNEIFGFILIQSYWNLSDLFVLPAYHNRGIGSRLVNAALKECIEKSTTGYVRVNSSVNAEGFYRKLGFESYTPEKILPEFIVPLIYKLRSVDELQKSTD